MILKVSLFTFSSVLLYVILFGVPNSLFTYHPLFIIIALVLTTEGVATVQEKKMVTEKTRQNHGILEGIGFFAIVLGVCVIYYNKELNQKPHFTTAHGQLGILTFVYTLAQVGMGASVAYAPGLYGGIAKAKKLYKYHRISGYLLLVLLWATTLYGIQTPFLLIHDHLIYIYYLSFTGILYSFTKKFPSFF